MKKYLFIASLALTVTLLKAQGTFQVTELISGSPAQWHYSFTTDTSDINSPTFLLEFKVKNNSGATHIAKVRKQILSLSTNTVTALEHDIYFCFNQSCFGPPTNYWFATMAPGASLPSGNGTYGLRTEMDHNHVIGTSVVRYTIYDSTNIGDSTNITITYNITSGIGIKNVSHPATFYNASPNPASNSVNFNYDLNGAGGACIKLYNSLGVLVKTVSLPANSKNTQLDISGLDEGFYFYSLISDGKAVATRRLVVTR